MDEYQIKARSIVLSIQMQDKTIGIELAKNIAKFMCDEFIKETGVYFSDRKSYWYSVKQEIKNI